MSGLQAGEIIKPLYSIRQFCQGIVVDTQRTQLRQRTQEII